MYALGCSDSSGNATSTAAADASTSTDAASNTVVDAGAVRFRPMMLTAAAVVAGSSVILFDPIFQGLAIALMAGEIASLALSRMTIPIVYYMINNRKRSPL